MNNNRVLVGAQREQILVVQTLNMVSCETSIRSTREAEDVRGALTAEATRRLIWTLRKVSRETLRKDERVPVQRDLALGVRFGMFHVKQSAGMSQRNTPRNILFWPQDPGPRTL